MVRGGEGWRKDLPMDQPQAWMKMAAMAPCEARRAFPSASI